MKRNSKRASWKKSETVVAKNESGHVFLPLRVRKMGVCRFAAVQVFIRLDAASRFSFAVCILHKKICYGPFTSSFFLIIKYPSNAYMAKV